MDYLETLFLFHPFVPNGQNIACCHSEQWDTEIHSFSEFLLKFKLFETYVPLSY